MTYKITLEHFYGIMLGEFMIPRSKKEMTGLPSGDDIRSPALKFGKRSFRFLFFCLGFLIVLEAGLLWGQTDLIDAYKSGPIHLEQDPEFGKDTDWKNLFYHRFCDLTVAPDGSILTP